MLITVSITTHIDQVLFHHPLNR